MLATFYRRRQSIITFLPPKMPPASPIMLVIRHAYLAFVADIAYYRRQTPKRVTQSQEGCHASSPEAIYDDGAAARSVSGC